MTHTSGALRDPPQNKRPTHTESEGLETNFPSKGAGKKAGVPILILDKIDLKTKVINETKWITT